MNHKKRRIFTNAQLVKEAKSHIKWMKKYGYSSLSGDLIFSWIEKGWITYTSLGIHRKELKRFAQQEAKKNLRTLRENPKVWVHSMMLMSSIRKAGCTLRAIGVKRSEQHRILHPNYIT